MAENRLVCGRMERFNETKGVNSNADGHLTGQVWGKGQEVK